LAQNQALMKHPDLVKACIAKIQSEASQRTDEAEDILGDDGKALLQQVLSKL
jgi:hypothetical protein